MEFNKYQTPVTEDELNELPQEIKEQFLDAINNIPFVRSMISPDRPRAKDLPRDNEGKIIIDITKPHTLEDTDYFRPTALYYKEYGCFTKLRPNANPNSEYGKWLREEVRRCWEGYIRESDGEWITGDMYFFLNYCPIQLIKKSKNGDTIRTIDFPSFFDGNYYRFHYLNQCRKEGHHAMELAKRGAGKAHPYDELVWTPEGLKKWKDIKIGDFLFGDDGNITKVIDIPFDGVSPIYEIELANGTSIQCSEGHLWRIIHHTKGEVVVTTKELLSMYTKPRRVTPHNPTGYELECSIPVSKGVDFNHHETKIDPYTFGLMLGDGCFRITNCNSKAYFTSSDEDFEVYKNYVPYNWIKYNNTKFGYNLNIPNFSNILKEYGLFFKKSEDKFIPKEYLYNSRSVRINILKGILDSDGTVDKGRIELTLSSKQLIEDVKWLCASLGINYTKERVKHTWYNNPNGNKVHCLDAYRLSIFSDIPLFKLPRKLEAWSSRSCTNYAKSKYKGSKIVNIRYVGEKKAKCVTVDNESHCYLINNFIVTHNSYSAASLLAKRFILGESNEVKKKVQCVATASERKYIQGANQLLDMFQYYIDFCANNTEFPSQRLTSSLQNMQWTMGYMDVDSGTRKGTQNSVIGITSKDDESKLRGSRGVLYLLEEAGCHIKGTECYKADKTIEKVENIKIGNSLLGPDMKPRKVLKVFTGVRKLYKITLSNGDYQIITDNHPVYTKVRTWGKSAKEEFKTFTCEELLQRNYKKGHYIVKQPILYEHKNVLIDPYMLGLWLGDGDSSRISFAAAEREIKEYFNSFKDRCHLRHLHNTDKCDVVYFPKAENQDLYNAFTKYNLFGNKHIPEDYKHNSTDVLLNLLAGIIDSDGYYDSNKHIYEIVQHSSRKDIIYDLKEIAEDLGMRCTITTKVGSKNSMKPGELYYRLFIRSNIEIPVKIEKKKFKNRSNYRNKLDWTEYSFTINYYGEGEYYGFLIDGDHLFLLKDRTIVHNSFPRLLNLYQVLRPSVEDGNRVFGLIYGYGCVTENNKVWTLDGRYISVKDLKKEDGIIGSSYSGIVKNPIGTIITPVEKECLRITLENDNYIECSIDHPILKQILHTPRRKGNSEKRLRIFEEGFVRADNLKVKDRIVEERAVPVFGTDTLFDARLVGMLIGDGTYGYNNTPCYASQDSELVDYIQKSYDTTIYLTKQTKSNKLYRELRIRNICKNLREIGIYGQTKTSKRLPINYQTLDYDNTRELLAGLFDTDGCIYFDKRNSCISLSQGNIEILKQVKVLLKKFGISCYICKNKPSIKEGRKDKNQWYVLFIKGFYSIKSFKENIPILVGYKKEKLEKCYSWFIDNPNRKPCGYNDARYIVSKIKSIENIGTQIVYNLSAVASHTYLVNNIITHNTSGDSASDFSSMQELMYNPDGYNIKGITNVYDKEGQGRRKFTYFYPGYLNRADCYDKDGNSDVTKAILEILKDRYKVKYNSTDINAITKRVAEIPLTPQEAIQRSRGNIFPITELTQRLNEIDSNPNFYDDTYVGTLVTNSSGKVEFSITTEDKPIRDFPTKDNKVIGALEIYEMPQEVNGKIPRERYIVSLDNYENDESDTMSLGSLFVLDLWTDRIVAEYTGRPMFVDDLNEIARKVCIFYNAKLLYENNKKNTFSYFSKMNSLHLLADTPEYLKNKQLIKSIGYGNVSKGVTATVPIKNFGFTLIRDWLLKPVTVTKEEDGNVVEYTVPNLHFIKNRALIKELMLFNPDINVDRIMSLVQLMLYREEKMILYQGDPMRAKKTDDSNYLGNDPFFTRNYKSSNLEKQVSIYY